MAAAEEEEEIEFEFEFFFFVEKGGGGEKQTNAQTEKNVHQGKERASEKEKRFNLENLKRERETNQKKVRKKMCLFTIF